MTARLTLTSAALLALLLLAALYLKFAPPELIRVGANYTAKIVCSNVFLAGRDMNEVLKTDVQAPGHPLLKWMTIDVDRDKGLVRANLFGLFGHGLALFRPGTGCAVVTDGDLMRSQKIQFQPTQIAAPSATRDWPQGSRATIDPDIEKIIEDEQLAGTGMRAIVVIHDGRLVAQRYGTGFNERSPLLGWSMSKTVTATLIGMQIDAGKLRLDQDHLWPVSTPNDERQKIKLSDLLSMTSGLRFNESYGIVSDVTRMLFLAPDMAAFAAGQPLLHPPGTFWDYSTGTAVILADILQKATGAAGLSFPRRQLFAPLGMSSAVMEPDEHGTLVGGSYMYATAQDWARFSQLLLQDGQWQGKQLVSQNYMRSMRSPVAASHGIYALGQLWLQGPFGDYQPAATVSTHFPPDTLWLQGHDGQSIAIIPSRGLIFLRMGLTPDILHYQPQLMLDKILTALPT